MQIKRFEIANIGNYKQGVSKELRIIIFKNCFRH